MTSCTFIRIASTILLFTMGDFSIAQSYKKLHNKAIVVDTHNDILEKAMPLGYSFDQELRGKTQSDLNRFKEGGVDVQIFSVWCDGNDSLPFAIANRQIDTLYATADRNPARMTLVNTPGQLQQAVREKKLAGIIGVEGGHMIENDLGKLQMLFERGARYLTLTHNVSTPWATSAWDETNPSQLKQPKGLNEFGRQIVKKMNELGMLVDVSHVGEQTFYDVIQTTSRPVIASHSCAYALCPVPRNLKDDQLKAIAKNGGVVQINFYSGFLDSNYLHRKDTFQKKHQPEIDSLRQAGKTVYDIDNFIAGKYPDEFENMRAPLSMVIDHIDYIVKLVGVDHVGLGSDFDGIESAPKELNGVEDFPLITKELVIRGYSKKDIRKILGGNFLRVFKANMNN